MDINFKGGTTMPNNNENKNNKAQNIQSENKTTQNNKPRLKPRDLGETRKGIFQIHIKED